MCAKAESKSLVPKHEKVAAALREEIAAKGLKAGDRLPSEGELCERFSASRGPVRQALAALENEGLIYRIQGAGSFVAQREGDAAGGARRRHRLLIVLGFEAGSAGVGAELIEGFNHVRKEVSGRARLSFEFGFDHFDRFLRGSPGQIQSECDGLIVVPVTKEEMQLAAQLDAKRVPTVACFRRLDNTSLPQVYIDQTEGAARATEYLLRYGHRRVALLAARDADGEPRYDSTRRIEGYRLAHERLSVPVDESLIVESSLSMDSITRVVGELLASPQRPTALLIGGSLLLSSALMAVHTSGLKVPEELSILAFDDSDQARYHSPALTVISQGAKKAARGAINRLLDQLDGKTVPGEDIPVRPELIVRDSCATLG